MDAAPFNRASHWVHDAQERAIDGAGREESVGATAAPVDVRGYLHISNALGSVSAPQSGSSRKVMRCNGRRGARWKVVGSLFDSVAG